PRVARGARPGGTSRRGRARVARLARPLPFGHRPLAAPMFLRTALLVLRKDAAIEAKSWEVLTTTVFFAVSAVLVFAFAFVKEGEPLEDAADGILWIRAAFSGTLALGRTFERERYAETLRALLLAPAPRPALYVGKLLGMFLVMSVTEVLLTPMVAVLFQAPLFERPVPLVALLALGTLGF